jgi:hypothetical protein
VQLEVAESGAPALDYFLDYELAPELSVRVGQDKIYFARIWWASDSEIDVLERPASIDALRYDRDVGVWIHGELLDGRLYYHAGASNGSGPNSRNDNIDLVWMARANVQVLGEVFEPFVRNLTRDAAPQLTVGAGVTHDLVRVPDNIAGIPVGNRDVDADGVGDNVRMWNLSADAVLRWNGLELAVEGIWRQERWGTILGHSDNDVLADAIDADFEGHQNYLGGYVHASYALIVDTLQVAARAGHSRVTLLGVGGRRINAVPPGDRLFEGNAQVRWFIGPNLTAGLSYTLFNYNASQGSDPDGDIDHVLIGQGQLNF